MFLANSSKRKKSKIEKEDKKRRYHGDISLSAVIDTKLSESEFLSEFSDDGLRAKLVLKTPDGSSHKISVLDVVANWTNWDEI